MMLKYTVPSFGQQYSYSDLWKNKELYIDAYVDVYDYNSERQQQQQMLLSHP